MDWIGNIFLIIGLWMVGDKKRAGFIFSIIGESIYVYYSYQYKLWGLLFICIIFGLLAIRGWYKWGQENAYWNAMLLPRDRIKWWQVWK